MQGSYMYVKSLYGIHTRDLVMQGSCMYENSLHIM